MNMRSNAETMGPAPACKRRSGWLLLAALALAALPLAVAACSVGGANQPAQVQEPEEQAQRAAPRQVMTPRPPINTSRNLYEGSLWKGAASWGNLLRDHRARFRGDLLTVIELQKIIKVPEVKPDQNAKNGQQPQAAQPQPAAAPPEEKSTLDPVLAFLRAQEKRREAVEREQNEILRSIDSIEVEVVRVLANGNMVVRGAHPPIFRDRNMTKYIVTLEGIVRPSDVDENNNVIATRISKAEVKIRRFVRREEIPLGDLARAGGAPKEGELLDRISSFLTSPGTGNRSTNVSPK
jgi:flagellar basal body L-ring protein FlgH